MLEDTSSFGGRRNQYAYFDFNETASAFIEAAYHYNWVTADFDWPKWSETQEAKDLRDDPEALARANPEQISRLLTVCIREDRFCEGALQASFQSGLLTRILRRSATILNQIEARAEAGGPSGTAKE